MFRQKHQKSVFNDVDETKFSARIRCVSSNQSNFNEFKSIKKECSNKFLRPFSPKKNINLQLKSQRDLIADDELHENNYDRENNLYFVEERDCLSSHRTLQTIDTNRKTKRQNNTSNSKYHISSEKPIKNHQSLLEKFQTNETKIILMRQELEKVFETFKQKDKEIQEKKLEMQNKDKIKQENLFLSKEIARVQEMIKEALLEREKQKYCPLNKRIKQ